MASLLGDDLNNQLTDISTDNLSDISGYGGNDQLRGCTGIDQIFGGLGDDVILGDTAIVAWLGDGTASNPYYFENESFDANDAFDDVLNGDDGRDVIYGGHGNDIINGGDGDDNGRLTLDDGKVVAISLSGGPGNDTIHGGNGNDRANGNYGNDLLYGDAGNDTLFGGNDEDQLFGGAGDDVLVGGTAAQIPDLGDVLDGGEGIDAAEYVYAAEVQAALDGSFSNTGSAAGDTYASIENISGSDTGNDILSGNGVDNTLWGNGGNDTLYGRAGNDLLYGYTGADILFGGDGNDELVGGKGADNLYGGLGYDSASYYFSAGVTVALDGSLANTGEAKGDLLSSIEDVYGSNTGNDVIAGSAAANFIYGNGGHDKIYGRAGNDKLYGYTGFDKIFGGDGNDVVSGGTRADVLSGGNGTDQYYYFDKTEFGDKIQDFSKDDYFGFVANAFGLAKGQLAAWRFHSSSTGKAHDGNDRFIFRTTDDTLWYDADGTGSTAAVLVADIAQDFKLSYSDILIV